MRWPAARSQEALDGLLVLARVAVAAPSHEKVPAVVVELIEALSADAMSESGPAVVAPETLGVVGIEGMTADEAGAAVGLTGKHVRRLCSAGVVRHTLLGSRYVVDVSDLRRHLRGDGAQ